MKIELCEYCRGMKLIKEINQYGKINFQFCDRCTLTDDTEYIIDAAFLKVAELLIRSAQDLTVAIPSKVTEAACKVEKAVDEFQKRLRRIKTLKKETK